MKKQKIFSLVLIVVALLAVGYGGVKWYEYSKTEVLETVETVLCNIGMEQLERVELKLESTIVFVKNDLGWSREDKPGLVYDQELMNTLIQDLIKAISYEKISNVQDMSVYGIDDQSQMLTLYGKEGQVQTLRIGKEVSGLDATYVSIDNNQEEIFAVENNKLGLVRRNSNGFIKKTLVVDALVELQSMEIVSKGSTVLKAQLNPNKGSVGFEKWIVVSPFSKAQEMNTEAMNGFIGQIKAFTKDYYVDDLTPEVMSKYGLDNPTLKLILNENTELVFGETQNDLIYFYTTGEPYIYKMPASKISGFETINAFDLIRKQIYVPQVEKLSEVQVTYGKETLSVKWVMDEKNPAQKLTYVNDQVVSEEVAKTLVNDIASLSIHSQLMNAELEQNQERDPEVVIRYIFNDHAVKTIELRPFDPSYYVLKNNGTIEFVVDKKQFVNLWNRLIKAKEIS